MSTRTRPAAKSYTARLQQRSAAPRPTRAWPAWLTSSRLPALLALCAELGHLAAALGEWPAAPARGIVHVLAAAALGLIATGVYFGPNRIVLGGGIGLGLALPVGWLAGTLLDASPYRDFPLWAAILTTAIEAAMAGLLVRLWQLAAPPPPPAQPAGRGSAKQRR